MERTWEYKEIDIAVSIFTDQMKKDLEYLRLLIRKNRKEYERVVDGVCWKRSKRGIREMQERCKREGIDPLLLSLLDKL